MLIDYIRFELRLVSLLACAVPFRHALSFWNSNKYCLRASDWKVVRRSAKEKEQKIVVEVVKTKKVWKSRIDMLEKVLREKRGNFLALRSRLLRATPRFA